MRKQTHAKKRKAAAPKRKVAKKAQRQIRGGAVTVIRPTSERIDYGTPENPVYYIVRTPGIVIFSADSIGEAPTTYEIGFGPRTEIAP